MSNYKDELSNYKNRFESISDIVEYYEGFGSIYRLRPSKSEKYFELIFNNQYSSPIYIPKITDSEVTNSPYFFLDDDNILLNLREMAMLVLITRFEFFRTNSKIKYTKFLKRDINALMKSITYIEPYAFNNQLKIQNRIRVVKTYKFDKKNNKVYYDALGDSLLDKNIPNTETDIRYYSKIFNDPISVNAPSQGIYCMLPDLNYIGTCYRSSEAEISTIFEPKSNLPERLRIHLTSNYLEPKEPYANRLLANTHNTPSTEVLVAFVPIQTDDTRLHPFGKLTFTAGEVYITNTLASKKYYVYRTFMTSGLNVDIVPLGTKLNNQDVIAYNIEGEPDIVYDLKYENAEVHAIEQRIGSYKITLKIETELSVGRLTNDLGLKGVTIPVSTLGSVELFDPIREKNVNYHLDMIIGPNSLKSGSNGVKLAYLQLKCFLEEKEININELDEKEINELTKDLKKVKWNYNDEQFEVYVGAMNILVTDSSNDCRSNGVRYMPESLKYLYLSKDDNKVKLADMLIDNYIDSENKWAAKELFKLRKNTVIDDDLPVWDINDNVLKETLNSHYFNITDSFETSRAKNTLLLNPENQGFYIKINDLIVRMPSARLINYYIVSMNNMIQYPDFWVYAMWLLYSMRRYVNNQCDIRQVNKSITSYYGIIDSYLFSKKKALSSAVSPVIDGGNLKQMVSPHVKQGTIVVVDHILEKDISDYKQYKNKTLYDIGVRNPVLWNAQLYPKKVYTFTEWSNYLKKKNIDVDSVFYRANLEGIVIRSIEDAMIDQSDTDGDLYPVTIPFNTEIQNVIDNIYNSSNGLKDYEAEWITEYRNGEIYSDKFNDLENKPFKYYTVERTWFAERFADSAIAKMMVGTATVDLWKFHSYIELNYLQHNITLEEMDYLQFLFSRIVQDLVVRGIKHNLGGSSGYSIFNLTNFNSTLVYQYLVGTLNIKEEMARLFCELASQANDDETSKALARLPNGGVSTQMSKYANTIKDIPPYILNNMSYAKIISKFIEDLTSIESIEPEEIDENALYDMSV